MFFVRYNLIVGCSDCDCIEPKTAYMILFPLAALGLTWGGSLNV
jgi:hypothetical protein